MGCNSYVVFVAFSINNNTFNLELICFLVNWLKGWCGVLFLRLGLLGLIVYLSRIDTANVTTGRLILKEWHWHFFSNGWRTPVSLHEGWRGGGVSQHLIAKFETQAQESCVPSLKVISRNIWKHSLTILSLLSGGVLCFLRDCLRCFQCQLGWVD